MTTTSNSNTAAAFNLLTESSIASTSEVGMRSTGAASEAIWLLSNDNATSTSTEISNSTGPYSHSESGNGKSMKGFNYVKEGFSVLEKVRQYLLVQTIDDEDF